MYQQVLFTEAKKKVFSKAAFTRIYKLIVFIFLVNKLIYKKPYLYIKT